MVHFREVQQFRQIWLWTLLLLMPVLFLLAVSPGGRPLTLLERILPLGFLAAVAVWFWFLRMITEVHDDGVQVQFIPLWRKRKIPFGEIRRATAKSYRPITEYGGWGIRWGPGGQAYNVSGDRGVLLELTDGRRVMIGSQRAEELEAAIRTRLAW